MSLSPEVSEALPRAGEGAATVAVIIPCYRVGRHALDVIARIGPEVARIVVVDDACPDASGELVERECTDPRVTVLRHDENQGVGGAVMTGYRHALAEGHRLLVKLDGDGQMDPALIPRLIAPILAGAADYTKGNRFYRLSDVIGMPRTRLLGNAVLSFMAKLSTGYWQLFDPTNGFTAIHAGIASQLPWQRIAPRYFFESDLLHQLNQLRGVVHELPMRAVYGNEPSSLRPMRQIAPFLVGHARNFLRRIVYGYFVRGFSLASVELVLGLLLLGFGIAFGSYEWATSTDTGVPSTAGTVMLAALPVILGMQLLLSWLAFDIAAEPRIPVSAALEGAPAPSRAAVPARSSS